MFRQLLKNHIYRNMKRGTKIMSVMFRGMVSGEMASFAEGYAKFIWASFKLPTQLLGGGIRISGLSLHIFNRCKQSRE